MTTPRRYDTVVAPHRLTSEPQETKRKLEQFVRNGGTLFITASPLQDIGATLLDVSVAAVCMPVEHAGQNITLCPLSVSPAAARDGAVVISNTTVGGNLVAVVLAYPASAGGGVLKVVGTGNYGMVNEANTSRRYRYGHRCSRVQGRRDVDRCGEALCRGAVPWRCAGVRGFHERSPGGAAS